MQGCISNLNSYFCPPPLDLYFFPKWNLLWGGERRREKISIFFLQFCKPIFVAILYILSQLGENIYTFYQLGGKNMHFPPFFIPFQSFFPPTCYLAIILESNRKIYTPVTMNNIGGLYSKQCFCLYVYNKNEKRHTFFFIHFVPWSASSVKRCSFQGAPPSFKSRTRPLLCAENRSSRAAATIFLIDR